MRRQERKRRAARGIALCDHRRVVFCSEAAYFECHGSGQAAALGVGIYATLGVFLIRAARDPLSNLSLIWFTVWSSVVHGGIMALQSLSAPEHHGHLVGDVPALFLVAIVLGVLTQRATAPAGAHRPIVPLRSAATRRRVRRADLPSVPHLGSHRQQQCDLFRR